MFPDGLNILGIFSLVILAVVCIRLTFIAWFDGTCGDLEAMKTHLRIIGIAQIAIVWTAVSIGADMVAACRVEDRSAAVEAIKPEMRLVSRGSIER
jgi:hypothetical protein